MLFHSFGDAEAPTLMMVHGAYTTWQLSFGEVIPLLAEHFHVIAVGVDGFDPEEDSEYENAVVEAERMVAFVRDELGGELDTLYGMSLGCHPAFYVALDRRIRVAHLVLDGAAYIDTGWWTPLTSRFEGTLARALARPTTGRLGRQAGLEGDLTERVYTGATDRSYRNTAWSNAAWCRDLRTRSAEAGDVHAVCWFGERERFRGAVPLLRRFFPALEVTVFPEGGHGGLLRHPAQFVAALRAVRDEAAPRPQTRRRSAACGTISRCLPGAVGFGRDDASPRPGLGDAAGDHRASVLLGNLAGVRAPTPIPYRDAPGD